MATESSRDSQRGGRALIALGVLVLGGLIVTMALPKPQERQYPQRIPVRFWHMWTAEWKTVVDQIADEYNRSQDKYEVIALSVPPSGASTKFVLSVAGGDPPDVMAQWDPVIPNWADSGLLQPLDDLMPADQWRQLQRDMYPIAKKIGIYKGRLYGVTVGLNVWACYYNIDHLKQQGLDPAAFPRTLEELFEWGKQLDRRDPKGNITRMGFLPEGLWQYATWFGNGFYDWQSQKLTIVTPDNLRAMDYMTLQRARLGYDNVERFRAGTNRDSFAGGWPFMQGAYSICIDGQWRVEQIRKFSELDPATGEMKFHYGTAPVPPPTNGRQHAGYSNGNFMIIPRGAKCPQGAWDFIKFWSGIDNPNRAASFYTMGGWLPLMPAIAEAPIYQDYLKKYPQFKTFVDVLPSENIQCTAPVPFTIYLNDRIGRADDLSMRGLKTPADALRQLELEVDQEISRRKEFGYDQ